MKKLMTVSAIALLLCCAAPAQSRQVRHVDCPRPLPNGQGLSDAEYQFIQSQINQMPLEALVNLARPACIRRSGHDDRGVPYIEFMYASDHYNDRLYRIIVRASFVRAVETEMLDPSKYVTVEKP